jgi:hypothetical protein
LNTTSLAACKYNLKSNLDIFFSTIMNKWNRPKDNHHKRDVQPAYHVAVEEIHMESYHCSHTNGQSRVSADSSKSINSAKVITRRAGHYPVEHLATDSCQRGACMSRTGYPLN